MNAAVYPNNVNIINFIRGVEPREPINLLEPVQEQLALVQKHGLPASWLLQYDALINPAFTDLLKREADAAQEIGVWFEVVQPLAEKAGIPWRGRYAWDWHAHIAFSVGYTPEERERLADVLMEDFRAIFGYYPRSVGSWFMDAHLLGYLSDRYRIVASCNCKDQWGTDGYTLWGGYYNQAYYPSRLNGFMPAQTEEGQIPVPVFRMLGSDPIYQYDAQLGGNGQSVITLEPVYSGDEGGGGIPEWVRWFFDVNFRKEQVSFGYAQVGQENSFGWDLMKDGLIQQVELLASKRAEGVLKVETLAESGEWFRAQYPVTPASSLVALTDWRHEGRQSVWYYNRFYRLNLLNNDGELWIRDIHLFDERYEERYMNAVCLDKNSHYDTLPVVDSARWSDKLTSAGLRPVSYDAAGKAVPVVVQAMETDESVSGELAIRIRLEGERTLQIRCSERSIAFSANWTGWGMQLAWGDTPELPQMELEANAIRYAFNGYPYKVELEHNHPPEVISDLGGKAAGGVEIRAVGSELTIVV
ncbi:hypothetical protein [Paenibacillus sacheonensis]|uniref:Uncharacterized protein n=1 Tax=Paenibacillus sacheonensis TaxID=742054 RepID=A0A7X4YVT4_9BACL|nr:hypothetical protein [Paenibacillus sacheonensis]MBM7568826.1 hypothetical protein [Paenibacillus sacheonensis]NBC72531.1 hypothetical protein [Paenibacillus sacheonensis]